MNVIDDVILVSVNIVECAVVRMKTVGPGIGPVLIAKSTETMHGDLRELELKIGRRRW